MDGAKYMFFFIFENVASFSRWIRKDITKYLETGLSNSSSLIMISVLVVYKKSVVSNGNLVDIFTFENESLEKLRKKILNIFDTIQQILVKSSSTCFHCVWLL